MWQTHRTGDAEPLRRVPRTGTQTAAIAIAAGAGIIGGLLPALSVAWMAITRELREI